MVILFVLPIVSFLAGSQVGKVSVLKIGREISNAIKKGDPLLFLAGHDRKLRLVRMSAGLTGYWHHQSLEEIPDEKAAYNFYGTTAGFATADTASNLSPQFLEYVQAWISKQKSGSLRPIEDILGRKIGTSPLELGKALYELQQKKSAILERLNFVKTWKQDASTMEEYIQARGFSPEEAQRFRAEVSSAIQDGGLALKTELEKIDRATEIEFEEEGWALTEVPRALPNGGTSESNRRRKRFWRVKEKLAPDGLSKTYVLTRISLLTLDDFWAFLPSGSNINRVWTMIKRAALADKLESDWNESKIAKWITIAAFVMMVTIGLGVMVYLVTK
jgi:hypothetical protein